VAAPLYSSPREAPADDVIGVTIAVTIRWLTTACSGRRRAPPLMLSV